MKWTEDDINKFSKSKLAMLKEREKRMKDPSYHEYIILTDSESFVHPSNEIIEGIHHLSDNNQLKSTVKRDMERTSKERQIQLKAFEQFEVECCKSF